MTVSWGEKEPDAHQNLAVETWHCHVSAIYPQHSPTPALHHPEPEGEWSEPEAWGISPAADRREPGKLRILHPSNVSVMSNLRATVTWRTF